MRPLHRVLSVAILAAMVAAPHRVDATCGNPFSCGTPPNIPGATGVILVDTGRSLANSTPLHNVYFTHGRTLPNPAGSPPTPGCANLKMILGDNFAEESLGPGGACTTSVTTAGEGPEDGLRITSMTTPVGINDVEMHFEVNYTDDTIFDARLLVAFTKASMPGTVEQTLLPVPHGSVRACRDLSWTVHDGETGEIQLTIYNQAYGTQPPQSIQGGETENYRWTAHATAPYITLTYDDDTSIVGP